MADLPPVPRLQWRDLNCKKIKINASYDDSDQKRKAKLLEFLDRTNVQVTADRDWDYAFTTVKAGERSWFYHVVEEYLEHMDEEIDWMIIKEVDRATYETIGIIRMPYVECELERQLLNELVSVPAGRFKGLLVDGGVEYQRQLARFSELYDGSLN